jgi:hypothetical protein
MQRYFNYVVNPTTNQPLPNPSITVYIAGTVNKATIYSDNGVTQTPNPTTGDTYGRFFFFAANAIYDLLIEATGFTPYTIESQVLFDPFTPNASDSPMNVESINAVELGQDAQGDGNFATLQVGGGSVVPSSSTIAQRFGTITTTAATSDALTVSGITTASHAFWVPLNAAAAAMTGLSLAPTTDTLTLNHPATADAIFDIWGSFE